MIENRTGANGTIGSNGVARSAPDGYTLLAATAGTHVTAVHLMKNLPYDPIKDFTPIIAAVEPVTCLAVNASLPVNSVPELIAYAKAHPDELSYGSSGVGSVFHLMGELFNETAGVRSSTCLIAVSRRRYRTYRRSYPDGLHRGRQCRRCRQGRPGQVPRGAGAGAIFEAAERAFNERNHSGVSQAVVVVRISLDRPDCRSRSSRASTPRWRRRSANRRWFSNFDANGYAPIGGTPQQFADLLKDGIERYGAIIKAAGIQPE